MMSEWSDLGDLLRTTRENLGFSIEDVSHRTRIPRSTLCQLEANDHSKFPSQAYTKSFLTQYCNYLNIDAVDLLDHFEESDALADLEDYNYLKDHNEHVDARPLVIKRPRRRKKKGTKTHAAPKQKESAPLSPVQSQQPLLVFSLTVLLIAGALFGFMKLSDSLGGEETVSDKEPAEVLGSIDGVTTPLPGGVDLSSVPRAVPVTPDSEENLVAGTPVRSAGTETLNSTPSTQGNAPANFSLDTPPPRAVIVEE